MGVCENGKANGPGVGVIQNTDGTAIEYYGMASDGLAHGAGLMIMHDTKASHTIEGNFVEGLADGAARISKPGQSDKLRTYQAGQDIGSASQLPASPFEIAHAR